MYTDIICSFRWPLGLFPTFAVAHSTPVPVLGACGCTAVQALWKHPGKGVFGSRVNAFEILIMLPNWALEVTVTPAVNEND